MCYGNCSGVGFSGIYRIFSTQLVGGMAKSIRCQFNTGWLESSGQQKFENQEDITAELQDNGHFPFFHRGISAVVYSKDG